MSQNASPNALPTDPGSGAALAPKAPAALPCEVAVIIPAYNAMCYLPEALHSVLNQTYQDFEVIIVNDGSKDGIESWYAHLADDIRQRVTLFSQPNQGISSARNAGINQTRSAYVAFLDADDIWLPHKLEQQIQYLKKHPTVSMVCSGAAMVDTQGRLMGRILDSQLQRPVWSQLVVSNAISTPSAVVVKRACLAAVGQFDVALSSYVEDKDLWLRIARRHTVEILPEVLIYKRRHPTNTSKKWQAMERASYQVLEKAFAAPPEDISEAQLQQLKRKSYGEANLKLAWKPLQTDEVQMKIAWDYLLKALSYRPALVLSKEMLKITCVMMAIALLGTQRYRQSLQSFSGLRYQISQLKRMNAADNRTARSDSDGPDSDGPDSYGSDSR
ncbi:MAG: glycosyltransferase family A protein [Phormidesmis sp.]